MSTELKNLSENELVGKGRFFFPVRYKMVLGTFILAMNVLIDRIFISVAKEPISESLSFTDSQMGWVLSIFALGYALFQTPSGVLADRLGPRKILTVVVTLWSIFAALSGAAWNFVSMMVVRFLFGAGEAGAFPAMSRAVYSWIPLKERGIVNGINFSGGRIGAALSMLFMPWLLSVAGWRMGFVYLSLIGFVWAVIWYWWFRDDPAEHPTIGNEEKKFILENRQQQSPIIEKKSIPLNVLFGSKNMWLLMVQYFAGNFTFFFALSWMFPHIQSTYNLTPSQAGIYASFPLIFGALGNWFSGWMVDFLYARVNWPFSRKFTAIVGFILAAIGLLVSVFMETPFMAVVFLSLATFGADMTLSPSWSACNDTGKENSGAVSGTMNMAGNLGSFITALAFPYLRLWSGSVIPFFLVGAGLNVLAIYLWTKIKPEKSIEEY
jgi:MFS transporter, ACS family, glucarate transporter